MKRSAPDVHVMDDPPLRADPEVVVAALRPFVSDARAARIEEVVAGRIGSVTLLLDRFHDPHNGGAVLRTADAFGLPTIHAVEAKEPFAISRRASQGAHKWVEVRRHPDPEHAIAVLRDAGFALYASAADGRTDVADLPRGARLALVFGNEHEGVSPALSEAADGVFRLPMRGFVESFNVSVAVALTLGIVTRGRAGDLGHGERARLRAEYYRRSVRAADTLLARRGLRE